jgi:hypothetical protein
MVTKTCIRGNSRAILLPPAAVESASERWAFGKRHHILTVDLDPDMESRLERT